MTRRPAASPRTLATLRSAAVALAARALAALTLAAAAFVTTAAVAPSALAGAPGAAPRAAPGATVAADRGDAVNKPPQARDWADLAKLPDWSGVWTPNMSDQDARIETDPVPWKPAIAAEVRALVAAEEAGNPKGLFVNCLPEAMPTWMLITHNAIEFLFTPGRVTLLGELDGNRLRRIYTDGRPHPADPDPTFHGHSIGHWEGDTLVVDTIGVLPETYIAVNEAVGIPNDGDMHIVERIHLAGPDILSDELEITAPHVMTKPWKTRRSYFRQRARKYDIVEGVCLQGNYSEGVDAAGHAVFVPAPQTDAGNLKPADP